MNKNYGKISSTEFNQWIDKISEYQNENCVESVSSYKQSDCFVNNEESDNNPFGSDDSFNNDCFISNEESNNIRDVKKLGLSESIDINKSKKKQNIIIQCSCLKINAVPLDGEYFDKIIPSISLLYKNKKKVESV